MRTFVALAAVLILALTASAPLQSQEADIPLSGVVMAPGQGRDGPRGRYVPLEGVRIEVHDLSLFAVTDSFGMFRLEGIPEGEHTLILRSPGYREFRRTITLEPGPPRGAMLSFVMVPLD